MGCFHLWKKKSRFILGVADRCAAVRDSAPLGSVPRVAAGNRRLRVEGSGSGAPPSALLCGLWPRGSKPAKPARATLHLHCRLFPATACSVNVSSSSHILPSKMEQRQNPFFTRLTFALLHENKCAGCGGRDKQAARTIMVKKTLSKAHLLGEFFLSLILI